MFAIFKRDFRSYMNTMVGPIFIAFMLLFTGVCVTYFNLIIGYSSFSYALELVSISFLFVVPILTMKSLSRDRENKTDMLLFSLPLKSSGIVMGKFLAIVAVFALPIAVMFIYPIILSAYGYMHYSASYSAIFALFLLGLALISVCMFISSTVENTVISAVISFGTLIVLFFFPFIIAFIPNEALVSFIGLAIIAILASFIVWRLTQNPNIGITTAAVLLVPMCLIFIIKKSLFEGLFPKFLSSLSLYNCFSELNSGIFDISNVMYLLSVTAFFLFLSVCSLEKRRWS